MVTWVLGMKQDWLQDCDRFCLSLILIPQPSSLKSWRTSFMFEVKASKRLSNVFRMPLGKWTRVVCILSIVIWCIRRCELAYRIYRILNRKTCVHWLQVHVQTRECKIRWVDKTPLPMVQNLHTVSKKNSVCPIMCRQISRIWCSQQTSQQRVWGGNRPKVRTKLMWRFSRITWLL